MGICSKQPDCVVLYAYTLYSTQMLLRIYHSSYRQTSLQVLTQKNEAFAGRAETWLELKKLQDKSSIPQLIDGGI